MRLDWRNAAICGDYTVIARFLAEGADPNERDRYGQTGLMLAARCGGAEVVRLLLEHGADLDVTAKYGLSALMLAVVNRHTEIARQLVDAGANTQLRGTGARGVAGKTAREVEDMLAPDTSPLVIVLITLAAGCVMLAWWLSSRNSGRTRALIAHLKEDEDAYWSSRPWLSRIFNPIGVIEAYRRAGQTVDPHFLALYEERKRVALLQISAILSALGLIAVILIGTTCWGWNW